MAALQGSHPGSHKAGSDDAAAGASMEAAANTALAMSGAAFNPNTASAATNSDATHGTGDDQAVSVKQEQQ
jgi:hypothetical protein